LEKNLEGRRGLSDRKGVRGRRIEREKSMDADTKCAEKMRAEGKRDRALAPQADNPRGGKWEHEGGAEDKAVDNELGVATVGLVV
jgi:hypothetical protein